ncbi:hypothetical protein [Laspinema sp. D2d]|nr:hypothetical protein [Laspinema sp. D2d]
MNSRVIDFTTENQEQVTAFPLYLCEPCRYPECDRNGFPKPGTPD